MEAYKMLWDAGSSSPQVPMLGGGGVSLLDPPVVPCSALLPFFGGGFPY